MTQTKWTPGPYFTGNKFSHGTAVYSKGACGVQVAFFGGAATAGKSGRYYIDGDECFANANLYAAALDLYEATGWIDLIQPFTPIDSVKDEETFYGALTGAQIRKLIKARMKARGEI